MRIKAFFILWIQDAGVYLIVFVIKATKNQSLQTAFIFQERRHRFGCNRCSASLWETVYSRADIREGDSSYAVFNCKSEAIPVCIGKERVFVVIAAFPDGANGMNHPFCFKHTSGCDDCFTNRAPTLPVSDGYAFFEYRRAAAPVDRAIYATAAHQAGVRCIDDGVDFKQRNITGDDLHALHTLFFVSMIIVTGPSFTRATFISAPNSPVWTGFPSCELNTATNFSYNGMAKSGFDAFR